jgi:HEAT repeat protein
VERSEINDSIARRKERAMASRSQKTLRSCIQALGEGSPEAQAEAIHDLGRLDDPRAIPALVATLKSGSPRLRALAMSKLVFLNNRRIVPALVKALADKEPRVRQHALYALQRLKVRAAAGKMARLMVGDRDALVRLNAAMALAAVGARRHVPAFVRALKDSNYNVVLTALGAIRRLAPREVSRHIVRLVRDKKRWAAVAQGHRDVTLALLRGSLEKKEVVALLRGIVGPAVAEARRTGGSALTMETMEAARLLAEAGDRTGVPVLLEALGGGEYSQEKAVAALAALKEASAVPRITQTALQNGFFPIKLKTIRALGEIGDVRALPALAVIFTDRTDDFTMDRSHVITKDDPDLRLTTLAAMARIARINISRAVRSPEPLVSKMARKMIAAL